MLLTITTTRQPATDLGYLLHKNPGKLHSFELSFGKAHIFYPEATEGRCTAALLLVADTVGRFADAEGSTKARSSSMSVTGPYVLSSFLSVAIGRALVCEQKHMGSRAVVMHECVFGVLALESEPVDPRL